MGKHPARSYIYRIQRTILLVFYSATSIALAIPLAMLVHRLSPNHLYPLIIVLLIYTLVVIVIGSLIHVISYIPFHLAHAFDPIQNDIASHRISTLEELGKRLTEFTVNFFDFAFLDVSHAFIQIDGFDITGHNASGQVEEVLKEYQMLQNSQKLDGLTLAGEISLEDGEHHMYILPICFEDRWLGYMALLSKNRISRFFQGFLLDFEDNFLDNQVMLLMHHDKKTS